MKILLVAATPFEIMPLENHLLKRAKSQGEGVFLLEKIEIQLLITGVGMTATAHYLTRILMQHTFDLVLHAGIAGTFRRDWELGKVVQIATEQFGDFGAEEARGTWLDIFDLKLLDPNEFPMREAKLHNAAAEEFHFLPTARGLTVQKAHGSASSIAEINAKYSCDIESMEGAAFFWVCLEMQVPFIAIRSISNYVEPRQRENWNIALAIERLNDTLLEILATLK